jgi:flavin-dependent dehydrogenase
MYTKDSEKPAFLKPSGIEYLIEVSDADYDKYAHSLWFFLGHKWMPKGYSWIFPMEKPRLKVGAASYRLDHKIIKQTESIRYYIDLLIHEHIQARDYRIIDTHGSTLHYSSGLQDIYYRDNIIAIGDAVSMVNLLGGEGIRHAMHCAEIAGKHIQQYLKGESASFQGYQQEIHQKFHRIWNLSEKIGMKRYLIESDNKIDQGVSYLTPLETQEMMDILFYYKFNKLSKSLIVYLIRKIRSWWKAKYVMKYKL